MFIATYIIGITLLIFSSYTMTNFEIPKHSFLMIGVSILLIMLIKEKYIIIPNNTICKLIYVFIITYTTSTIFSISPFISFWGNPERQQGLFTYILYLILFLSIYNLYKNKLDTDKYIKHLLNITLLISIYGIIEYIVISSSKYSEINTLLKRIVSTVGHPNTLATILIMLIPLCIYLILKGNKIYYIHLLLNLFILINTYSRSAFITTFILILIFLYLSKHIYTNTYIKYAFISVMISTVAIITMIKIMPDINTYITNHINLINSESNSVSSRFIIYNDVINLIKKNIWGYGPETLWIVYPQIQSKELLNTEMLNTVVDKSHNFILDIFYESGVLSFIIIIITIIYWIKINIKYIIEKKDLLIFILFLSITGNIIINLFNFNTTATYTLLIFLFTIWLKNYDESNIKIKNTLYLKLSYFIISIILIVLSVNFYIADIYFAYADKYNNIQYIKIANEFNPFNIKYKIIFADAISNNTNPIYLLDDIKQYIKVDYYQLHIILGQYFKNNANHILAEKEFEKALKLAPYNTNTIIKLADIYYLENKNIESYDLIDKHLAYLNIISKLENNTNNNVEKNIIKKHYQWLNNVFEMQINNAKKLNCNKCTEKYSILLNNYNKL